MAGEAFCGLTEHPGQAYKGERGEREYDEGRGVDELHDQDPHGQRRRNPVSDVSQARSLPARINDPTIV